MINDILQRLASRFGPSTIAESLADFLPDLVTGLVIFIGFVFIWKLADRTFRLFEEKTDVDETLSMFAKTSIKFVILTIGALTALSEIGINVASIVASLGIAGLTIGFAARDTLSNLISGIFIFWDRPFVVGDLIEVAGEYGRVDHITLRSTRVVTVDGKMLAIPNSTIVNSVVASYTNFPHIRLQVPVTLGVEEDLVKARKLFIDMVTGDERYMKDPPPQMIVNALNDYNVEVEFRVWLHDEKSHIRERFDLRERIFELFRTEGMDMPYETIQLMPMKNEVEVRDLREVS